MTLGQEVTGLGAGGQAQFHWARIESLKVGDAEIRGTEVVVAGFLSELSAQVGTRLDGVLGYDFLRAFRVTIDYPHRTLHLDPKA